ncbi:MULTISPECIES: hypothetical protein [Sulfurovum]|uniref:Uncharacterized protein n=1 Tax=Sulfurovum xiamenensis TaxID=3019066 RepID=A0ABT7QNZ5_9BACT|nr:MULTISPECIES: hypothetical protein [Sulfurovum]EIF50870.1 hypothetical protein SULAR_05863 [Sulfurovum sp. AR]MDM5262800.1 hypothetical protein [Sulfurovum xiamenensis]
MTKIFMGVGVSFSLMMTSVSADDLKNSLTDMLKTKETSGMVDLGNINLDAKPKQPKTRSSKAVIATVNGHKIIKKEADSYLDQRTQGKVTNFDHLPPEQRSRLIQELALPMMVLDAAQKELSEEEKQAVYTRAWMQKEARKINVTDEQALTVYNQLKQQAEENNTTQNIPPFESIKDKLKIQIIEKTLVDKLIKDAKIEVL